MKAGMTPPDDLIDPNKDKDNGKNKKKISNDELMQMDIEYNQLNLEMKIQQAEAELEQEEQKHLKIAELLGYSEDQLLKIQLDYAKKSDKLRDKVNRAERHQTMVHYASMGNMFAGFIDQFRGGQKVAARIKQTSALINAYKAASDAWQQFGGWPGGVVPAAASLAQGLGYAMQISKSIGEYEKAQFGMDEIVTKPTLILAGEAGAEQVSITPLEGPNLEGPQETSSTINVSISGNILTEDFVEGELADRIKDAVRRGTDFGIG